MDYVWGPAAGSAWGNALLSRFPIAGHGNYAMPNNDEIRLDRAVLPVEVDVGGGEVLDVVATHFHLSLSSDYVSSALLQGWLGAGLAGMRAGVFAGGRGAVVGAR